MRLYTSAGLPNPDVVHLYQAETGTEACAERVQLDVRQRENRTPEMLAINPLGEIPWLITDGGFCITARASGAVFHLKNQAWNLT